MSPVIEITQTLVRMPSVNPVYDPASPGAKPVLEWVAAWGAEHGFAVERHPVPEPPGGQENVILRLENGPGPHLLFNGHLDTVSVAGMTIPPFGGELRDGQLWGRGSCDMKGPVAAMLVAAEQLRQDRQSWSGTLTLAFTPDEEVTTYGIRALMEQLPRPDFAIVGEPSTLKPLRGCKGSVRFILRCHGRAAHSSRPSLGRSAVVAMSKAVIALDDYFRRVLGAVERPQFGSSTGSVGIIKGGTGINIVPDGCEISVDVRLVPGQDADATFATLQEWFAAEFPAQDGISWSWEVIITDPAFETAPDHPLTRTLCELTQTAEADVAFYCCDASKIAALGIPCLILGPGDIAHAHTADERVSLEALEAGVELYARVARTLLPPAAK